MGSEDNAELTREEYVEYCLADARELTKRFDDEEETMKCKLLYETHYKGDV